jgi:RHS repeat-associated protein
LSTDFLFTGEQRDDESDLYYLRARYYDPSTGRFLTQDPFRGWAGLPQSQNRYPYVLNNPANLVDPAGLQAEAGTGTFIVICGAGGAESGGTACAVGAVVAAGVVVCVAGACEALGQAGGALIEEIGSLAGNALGWLRSVVDDEGRPVDDTNWPQPDFSPWVPPWWEDTDLWGPNGYDPKNLPPWMKKLVLGSAAATVGGIVLGELGSLFGGPPLHGEKPPARWYYSP